MNGGAPRRNICEYPVAVKLVWRISPFWNSVFYCLCGLVVRIPVYRSRGPWFDSRRYQIFWEVVRLERGPLSLVSTTEELLGRNSSGSGLENREYGDPLRWPCDTLYPQKLALTSLTCGGHSVGIVRLRTKTTEFVWVQRSRTHKYTHKYSYPSRIRAATLACRQALGWANRLLCHKILQSTESHLQLQRRISSERICIYFFREYINNGLLFGTYRWVLWKKALKKRTYFMSLSISWTDCSRSVA
jgi:hypothetical protein